MAIRYRPLRQRRINRLLQYGYTKQEAVNITKLKSGNTTIFKLNRPYFRIMMRERYKKYRQAIKEGISKAEWKKRVSQEYIDNGWLTPEGTPDYWAMFRFHYRRSIQLGQYKPPSEKRQPYDPTKPHKKKTGEGLIDREYIKRQRAKYQAKTRTQPAMTGDRREWIEQLRKSMDEAKTPHQREQFRKQIENLGGTP